MYGNLIKKIYNKATKPTKQKQTKKPTIFFWNGLFLFEEKTGPVSFEPRTFGVPGALVSSKLVVPETLRNLNPLWTMIDSRDSVKQVVNPQKSLYSVW